MNAHATKQFIDELLATVPELRDVYDEHLRDNDELLPHVFMGDVTRFVVSSTRRGEHQNSIDRILQAVERGLDSEDKDVQNLVAVSFIENLADQSSVVQDLIARIGPNTRYELRRD